MDKVIIYGTGRHAELTAHEMKRNNLHEVVAFTVRNKYLNKSELNGYPVVSYEDITRTYPPDEFKMFIAVGPQQVNRAREEVFQDAKEKGYHLVNCIWPIPDFPEDLIIGENVYIGQECAISNFVEIGDNVTLITSKIGHHCKIKANSFISASILAGNVQVEKNVFIGLGSVIGPNITLGEYTVVGMGCTISKSTDPASVYLNKATEKQSFDSSRVKLL
jgi:sugar O-acyltransferase (sialic acid O-acetyltransferase NeuD family)